MQHDLAHALSVARNLPEALNAFLAVAVEVEGVDCGGVYLVDEATGDLNLAVHRGEIFGLLGPNGGGKSTLFRILSTMLPPQTGQVRVFDCDVVAQRNAVRRQIGVVFQSPSLDKKLTILENLRHHGHIFGLRGAPLQQRITELLERFGIADRANELTEKLSGGLRRRVEIARGLLHKPALLLLDEPSTGLDPRVRREVGDYLAELRDQEGVTVLVTTVQPSTVDPVE